MNLFAMVLTFAIGTTNNAFSQYNVQQITKKTDVHQKDSLTRTNYMRIVFFGQVN